MKQDVSRLYMSLKAKRATEERRNLRRRDEGGKTWSILGFGKWRKKCAQPHGTRSGEYDTRDVFVLKLKRAKLLMKSPQWQRRRSLPTFFLYVSDRAGGHGRSLGLNRGRGTTELSNKVPT
jgi:hypothetical protein